MGDHGDPFMRNQNAAVQARTKAQNRANVLQLKLIGQSHPTGLTNNLLKLFEPRPPLEFKPPPEKRKCPPLTGIGQFVEKFAEPGDPEYAPPVQKAESPAQRRARIHKLRLEKGAEQAAEELKKYDPSNDPNASGDPYKTLFVARLSYETTESRIKREFESYGPIKRVRLVSDKLSNKPKGYAFIEYMHTRDMKAAYKQADGRKIDGRRVLVDVERGRTVPNWRPRRLGGGLGTSRVGNEELNQQHSGREQQLSRSSQSAEPRARDGRDRERSRERGREKEREKSRDRSSDRGRDREHREDRHHRDRDRARDRDRERERDSGRDREKDRGRDRDRTRDRERERDPDRDRDHGRHRDRERDYDGRDTERHSRDRESEYDRVDSKHERDRPSEKEREYENEDQQGWYEQREHGYKRDDHEPDHYEHHGGRSKYDNVDDPDDYDRYNQYADDQMEDDYHKDRTKSDSRDKERADREHRRSKRSSSKDREY